MTYFKAKSWDSTHSFDQLIERLEWFDDMELPFKKIALDRKNKCDQKEGEPKWKMAITDVPCRFSYVIESDTRVSIYFNISNGTYYYEPQRIIFARVNKYKETITYEKDAPEFSTVKYALVYVLNELEEYVKQGKHKVFYNKFLKIAESNAKV